MSNEVSTPPSENLSKLESRVNQAAKVMKVEPSVVWTKLAQLGIEKDDQDAIALLEADTTQEGDARRIFVESSVGGTIPIVRFKAGWQVLRGKAEAKMETKTEGNTVEAILNAIKSPNQMSDKELLDRYSPDSSSDICEELERRSHDRPFIVFDEAKGENAIDVEATLNLLRVSRRQDTPSTYKASNGKIARVYRVGEFPMSFIEECPVHPDVILVEDYCERCMDSWAGISNEDRVLVRVAKDIYAIDVSTIAKVNELLNRLKKEGGKFLLEIPAVQLRYSELQSEGKLPILRRRFSSSPNRLSDPFYIKR